MLIDDIKQEYSFDENAFVYAYYTDKILFQRLKDTSEIQEGFLLELRIFDQNGELKYSRVSIEDELKHRYIDDTKEYFEEEHYLDIDSKQSVDGTIRATGGGKYPLPIDLNGKKDAYLVIHNYVSYYEKTGQAYISDYRLVDLKKGDVKNEVQR